MKKILKNKVVLTKFGFTLVLIIVQIGVLNIKTFAQNCTPVPVGLVSWWQGDSNALDSRSGSNGALQNGATFAAGQIGQAFDFNGSNSLVNVPHNPSHNITGSFTAEVWIYPRSIPNQNTRIIEKDPWNIVLRTSPANALNVNINNGGAITTANAIPLNQWTHVAFTVRAGTGHIQIYINGILNASGSTPSPITSGTEPFLIGNNSTLGFDGLIDEPALYDRILSDSEIAAIANAGAGGKCKPTATIAPSGLAGWWPGDGHADDISGNGNTAVLGDVNFGIGKVGQGFKTVLGNGSTPVNVSDSASLDFTNAYTIEMWVSPIVQGQPDGTAFFACKGNCAALNDQPYSLGFGSDRHVFLTAGNSSTIDRVTSTTALPLGSFSHLVGTYDGATLRIYINGVLDNSKTTTIGTLVNSSGPFTFNGSNQFGVLVPGTYDEVSLYNRALTDAEIASIFNAGLAGKLKTAATPSGFADFYKWKKQKAFTASSPQAVSVTVGDVTVNFPSVTTAGTTQQIPLDLSLFPGSLNGLAYDIATSAVFAGNPTVCFDLPSFTLEQYMDLRILHFENGIWSDVTDQNNSTYPRLCTVGISSFSPFAVVSMAPTAASVSISGRVFDSSGRVVYKAAVSMTDMRGEIRTSIANPFGYYRFEGVRSGEIYFFNVLSKEHQFQTQIVNVNNDITNLNFTALP